MASIPPKVLEIDPTKETGTTETPPPTAVPAEVLAPIDTSDIGISETEKTRKLEKLLSDRPDKTELVEKNVLKPGDGLVDRLARSREIIRNLAPSLQAKQAELSKSRLEDKLNAALAHRPEPEKLVQEGILTEEETAALKAH